MSQADIAHIALRDLERMVTVPPVAVFMDWDGEYTQGIQGLYLPESESSPRICDSIWLNPSNHGRALYRVALHEIGHHLGLNHTRVGIMAPRRLVAADFDNSPPTPLQRKRWTLEIVDLVIEQRAKKWRVA